MPIEPTSQSILMKPGLCRLLLRLLVTLAMLACTLCLLASCSMPDPSSNDVGNGQSSSSSEGSLSTEESDAILAELFQDQRSDVQVEGVGTVVRLLSDDTKGSKHQRFILELASGQTLLIAHNIDLAPRLDGLEVGETVGFYGVYEYSDEGGTVHWTHRDPDGSHVSGWLSWNGRKYQ